MVLPAAAAAARAAASRGAATRAAATEERRKLRSEVERVQRLRQQATNRLQSQESQPKKEVTFSTYALAFLAAGLKDLLDLAFIGSLPGIGTAVTLFAAILIFINLALFPNVTADSRATFLLRAGAVLLGGTIAEGFLFGLNFFPGMVGTVFAIYLWEKRRAA